MDDALEAEILIGTVSIALMVRLSANLLLASWRGHA
jgi:hypothetical protein